jgi:hypothetical protein
MAVIVKNTLDEYCCHFLQIVESLDEVPFTGGESSFLRHSAVPKFY